MFVFNEISFRPLDPGSSEAERISGGAEPFGTKWSVCSEIIEKTSPIKRQGGTAPARFPSTIPPGRESRCSFETLARYTQSNAVRDVENILFPFFVPSVLSALFCCDRRRENNPHRVWKERGNSTRGFSSGSISLRRRSPARSTGREAKERESGCAFGRRSRRAILSIRPRRTRTNH